MVSLARPSWKQRGRDGKWKSTYAEPRTSRAGVDPHLHRRCRVGACRFAPQAGCRLVHVFCDRNDRRPDLFRGRAGFVLGAIGASRRVLGTAGDRLRLAHSCGRPDRRFSPLGCHHRGASVVLLHSLYAALPGIRSRPLLPVFFAVPGRDVWIAQYHRHDVVLLHLLADDDFAGICAHLLRKQKARKYPRRQQISTHDADCLCGHYGWGRTARGDWRGRAGQRASEI